MQHTMNATCRILMEGCATFRSAKLVDRHVALPEGTVAVLYRGALVDPDEILEIRINSSCPLALFDAAIDAGYYVVGFPDRPTR